MQKSHRIRKGRATRIAPLIGLGGRTAGEAVVESLRQRIRGESSLSPDFHARAAQRYADQLGRSKGVLMKAGQLLSFTTLGPALGDDNLGIWQRALARLQDDAPPMPADVAAAVITAELGPPEQVFARFDSEPIAAASIGQVHSARTHAGVEVAVKIQYPGVQEAMTADLQNTELLATFFQLIRGLLPQLNRIDARAVAREIAERIGEEVNYWSEAVNQSVFADAYRGHPFIKVPELVPALCTERVLTMERGHGRRFSEIDDAPQHLKDAWGEAIGRFAFGSVRRLRMFHADPHPGNYLFADDGTVTFLDFGCVRRYSHEHIDRLAAMLDATVAGDAEALTIALIAMQVFDPSDLPDAQAALTWQRQVAGELVAPQPYTFTAATAAEVIRVGLSPFGPNKSSVTRANLDPAYVMLNRINLGLKSVLGALNATGYWESMRREWDHGDAAATRLGELDQEFWATK